jgi:flagellar hook-length control protein FliK
MMPAPVNALLPSAPKSGTPTPGPAGAEDGGAFGRELQRLTDAAAEATHDAHDDAAQDAAQAADTPDRAAPGKAGKRSVAALRADRLLLPGGSLEGTPATSARADAPRDPTGWPGEQADTAAEVGDAPASAELSAWMASLLGAPATGRPDAAADAAPGLAPTGGRQPDGAQAGDGASANRARPAASGDRAAALVDGARASQGTRSRAAALDDKQAVADATASGVATRIDSTAAPRAALRTELLPGRDAGANAPSGSGAVGGLPFGLNPAALATAATAATAAAVAPVETALIAPLSSPEFAPAVGAQIARFARDGIEHARLHLNPAEMGPIAVQVAVDGPQVRVDLVADIAATRQALEQSLPALAGALRDAGFTLAGGGVFQQARDGTNPGDPSGARPTPANGAPQSAATTDRAAEPARTARPQGLVDLFA